MGGRDDGPCTLDRRDRRHLRTRWARLPPRPPPGPRPRAHRQPARPPSPGADLLGTPPSLLRAASAEERHRIRRVLEHIQPLSERGPGLRNDAAIARSLPRYDLERIQAPTLVVAFEDCLYGTYPGARYTAEHIPNARLVSYPTGGHLWVGHERDVAREVVEFLKGATDTRPILER